MRIKKFFGATLKEAVEAMKKELGPEAIVLHTRTINRKGKLSLFGKGAIEITGAIDELPTSSKQSFGSLPAFEKRYLQQKGPSVPVLAKQAAARFAQKDYGTDEDHAGTERLHASPSPRRQTTSVQEPTVEHHTAHATESLDELKEELADVKEVLRHIQDQMKQVKIPALPTALREAYLRLLEQDVEEQLAAELVHSVFERLGEKQSEQGRKVEQELLSRIASMIKVNALEQPKRKSPVVIALVGPTGVGKTTTIAKLSSVSKLLTNKDVALLSADTYRIGAIEQLKTFAAIAAIPMEVVYEPSDVRQSLKEFRDKDVLYLDTVGRSQRNENDLAELQMFLKAAKPDEVHLVLNPSMSFKTITDVVERFKVLHPNRLLFTKLDEATTFGSLLNLAYRYNLPVSYVCNGQMVPDDLREADSNQLASLVYKGALVHA